MTTTLSEGVKVPDVGSVNWAGDLEVNWNLLNGALANLSGNVKLDRDNTWTGEQSFTLPIVGSITGTASKAIADEDGTSIKTGYVNVAGNQTVTGNKDWTGTNRFSLSLYQKGFSSRTSAPASNEFGQLSVTDTNNASIMSLNYANRTTGARDFTFRVYDSTGNVNGAGIYKDAINNYSFRSIDPNNPIPLGTSTNQWSSVYAQTYYYNGTQWGLDKANEWTQSQTTTGVFSIKNTSLEKGVIPSAITQKSYYFSDKNGASVGVIRRRTSTTGAGSMRVYGSSLIKDGQLDPTGTEFIWGFGQYLNPDGTTYFSFDGNIANSVTPNVTNTYSLGTSTNQWSSVYAQSYYYNGTAWGLDKSNVWTGNNTFTSTITTKTNVDRTVAPTSDSTYGTIVCRDKNGSAMFRIQGTIKTDLSNVWNMMMVAPNNSYITFFRYTISSSSSDRELRFKATSVIPDDNSTADLGTSTNKWKTFNGVNPGALSFPNPDSVIEIDTTGWDVAGGLSNTYTPLVNGWLNIDIKDTATSSVFIYSKGLSADKQYCASVYGNGSQGQGRLSLMIPALANTEYAFVIKADSLSDVSFVRFFPCLGNV